MTNLTEGKTKSCIKECPSDVKRPVGPPPSSNPKKNDKWISVKDSLPLIPKGKYGVSVLVAVFDHVYEEINPGHGYDVTTAMYGCINDNTGKPMPMFDGWDTDRDFMQLYIGKNSQWGPFHDEITHWMYLPDPPKK